MFDLVNKIISVVLLSSVIFFSVVFIGDKLYYFGYYDVTAVEDSYPLIFDPTKVAKSKKKGLEDILPLLASADTDTGSKLFRSQCATCHYVDPTKGIKNAPNLWQIVNRDKGSSDYANYSDGLKNFGGKWDYASLNQFLYKPKGYIKGTKMAYAGVRNTEERANIVAYLRTLNDAPAPLPTTAE
jgi:cytochrome c